MSTRSITTARKATIPDLRRLGRRAEAIADPATNDDARDVHQFLASTDLLSGTVYGRAVHHGRALIEWYADELGESNLAGADISLADVACVLEYLSAIHSINPNDCYGHSCDSAASGYHQVIFWLCSELRRLAQKGGTA